MIAKPYHIIVFPHDPAAPIVCESFETEAQATAYQAPEDAQRYRIDMPSQLEDLLDMPQLVALYNHLASDAPGKVESFPDATVAAGKCWNKMNVRLGETNVQQEAPLPVVRSKRKTKVVLTEPAAIAAALTGSGDSAPVTTQETEVTKKKAGTKRSGKSVAERILAHANVDGGKTAAQIKTFIRGAFSDRTETAVDNTVRGTLSQLARDGMIKKIMAEGKALAYETTAKGAK